MIFQKIQYGNLNIWQILLHYEIDAIGEKMVQKLHSFLYVQKLLTKSK